VFGSLLSAAVRTVATPVFMAADVVVKTKETVCDEGYSRSMTVSNTRKIVEDLDDAAND